MKHPQTVLAVVAILGHLWAVAPGSAAEPPRRPELTPCHEAGMPPESLCGTYEVFENRAAQTGRKIPLRIVVLPATGPRRLPDPFVYFAGGPGLSSIPDGLGWATALTSLRQKRDVLLIDLRGTGESGGLFCRELKAKKNAQAFLDDFLPVAKIHACRDRLKADADLSWYTTDAAVDDVEEVRAALGYGPLNLVGGSWGSRAVLTYLRRHPGSVRTATLDGVLPPDAQYLLRMASNAQEMLDRLIGECEGDPVCRGAFPRLRQELDAVLSRVTAQPVRVELTDPASGGPREIRLTRAGVSQTLRYMLYSPVEIALLPLQAHLAAQGDWKPLARSAFFHETEMSMMAEGFYQSVSCSEDVPFLRDKEIAAAVAGTFLGDFRIRRQQAACEGWPVRDLGPDVEAPVHSDVPALLLSGARDPATPPAYGELAARTLPHARHVVLPESTHSSTGMQGEDCLTAMVGSFIEAGTAEGLDTSCIARMRRPEVELPEVKVAKADLERLQGSYANTGMNMALKADILGDRLRLSITEGPSFPPAPLVPTSPTRFRWEGDGMAPGLAVVFQVTGGRAAALTVLQPGKPPLVMRRASGPGWKPSLLVLAAIAASIGLLLWFRRFRRAPAESSRIFA